MYIVRVTTLNADRNMVRQTYLPTIEDREGCEKLITDAQTKFDESGYNAENNYWWARKRDEEETTQWWIEATKAGD